ncbi:glycogen operon protein [Rhodoblastus acidophilus]|uniref:Glycogen operon protein n=1 Tax=Rhodoblastus acidophilus TaxID=1074 RepID=A0A212R3U9_RHOAC|nr:glycogen debranching protein GlgX [Rhodoblastus acidophilus]PPQ40226.1 glycogen debranching enzyme GlgX [Rhodoblastus acidophilus]RAI18162.1 glycogen debranching enzyme GlgX [Rhodoblastus acidophilus]SNB66682.1 glycogen operon protein [Rhodoblastus acidophilus]
MIVTAGAPEPLGLRLGEGGANIAVFSETAERIDLCLFDAAGAREIARLTLPGRTGPVFHGFVPGLQAGALYGLRAYGPYAPERGLYFNPRKLLLDPFALELDAPARLHPSFFPDSSEDSAAFAPKAKACDPQPAPARRNGIPWRDTIIYEAHVRGFTKLLQDVPEKLRGTFAGLAHPAAIAHLQKLGVTALELLPCAAGLDERHLHELGLSNYWGYNPVAPLAPDPRLAPGGWAEVREAVAALHAAGLEVLIDVVFNHTAEGDGHGPLISLRGLDNPAYYRLYRQNPAAYINDAGCGNILRADHPAVIRLTMDALRAWAIYGGVDGFRFDLMTTLGRRADGFDPHAPLFAALAQDPALRGLKLIAEPWDLGPGGYQIGAFPANWGEWNDRYRDAARKFWRGDSGMIGDLATRLAGSADLFAGKKPPSRSINFVTAHDGFTLADLVSYAHKHNEANGEANRDGTDANYSWNNGVEGETADATILAARRRDQRALLATLIFSRGTPMLSMGAEFGQSQRGNNNAYAQDNEISWLDWAGGDPRLLAFAMRALALRRAIPAFTDEHFLTGAARDDGPADVEWWGVDGPLRAPEQWQGARHFLGAVFTVGDSRAALLLNAGSAPVARALPHRAGKRWRLALDSQTEDGAPIPTSRIVVAARSAAVFVEDVARPPRKTGAKRARS